LADCGAGPSTLASTDHQRLKGKHDRALLAFATRVWRRHEAAALRLDHLQHREEHWAI
jgi:hypothetical protein